MIDVLTRDLGVSRYYAPQGCLYFLCPLRPAASRSKRKELTYLPIKMGVACPPWGILPI